MNGHLILLLHAHLPYVRHPEYEYALEENWLFEAIRETYLPLLDILEQIVNDGISPRLTLSISPPLIEMLNDDLLKRRFVRSLYQLIELSEAEIRRTRRSAFEPLACLYHAQFKRIKKLYEERYGGNLVASFKRLQDDGHIEIVTTAATHAFLPAFAQHPDAVRRQIALGVRSYSLNFGREPAGFWLPECGYYDNLDVLLREARIRYTFLESHGVTRATPRPRHSIYRPVLSSAGVYAFGRDFRSAQQVWCATRGYPGDPFYRDFYRDIGFDLSGAYISSFTRLQGIRTFTGIKYHRVTGRTERKLPYDRAKGIERAAAHALHFVRERASEVRKLSSFGVRPVLVAAFDAELFGHWWYEGVTWLDSILRNAAERTLPFCSTTPSAYLDAYPPAGGPPVRLAPSSWGEGGFNALWIGRHNCSLYRHLHVMAERMEVLERHVRKVQHKGGGNAKESKRMHLLRRAVHQAMREMLLAQSSDWLFLMEKGRAAEYAERRITRHIERFNMLFSMVQENAINESWLKEVESSDRIFPWLDNAEV